MPATIYPAADFTRILGLLGSDHTPINRKVELMNDLHPMLSALFDKVRPASHWKDPIDAVVPLTTDELAALPYAIEFFTATKATITPSTRSDSRALYYYHVYADGYRNGPAGDH